MKVFDRPKADLGKVIAYEMDEAASVSFLRDYQWEAVAAHRFEEEAICTRLLRRCNNGRKAEPERDSRFS